MARIKQLSNALINQIAAGEVIERPASVLKEIVENAIDAGAHHIHIDIEEAGSKLIRVRDDGCGIHSEDLALAFCTHATSKIRSFDDLEHVLTLGFRGEALPSIASVSKTMLTSRTAESEHAYKIAPYISMKTTAAAHPQGTTIEIRDLFYNTPARKKFLKTERTERQHIQQLLERMTLSQNDLQITLNNQDKQIAQYGGKTEEQRINSVLGVDFLEQAIPVGVEKGNMHLRGWVGLPTYNHNNTDKQYFFINGRMIRDKIVVHAIRQAYEDVLYNKRQPIFILHLYLPPELVDVNAHPQKHEVRFREARLTHDFIFSSLNHALRGVRPTMTTMPVAPLMPDNKKSTAVENISYDEPPQLSNQRVFQWQKQATSPNRNVVQEAQAYYQWAAKTRAPLGTTSEKVSPELDISAHPLGYALGQINQIFILAQNIAGLVIVDMHAAHERVLYERFKKQLRSGETALAQKLLITQSVKITPAHLDILKEHENWLEQLGYQWHVDANILHLDTVPALLKHVDNSEIINDVLNELADYPSSRAIERLQDEILSSMSCHRAVRAHDKLSLTEMNQLLRDIESTPSAGQCNHGRPTWIQLTEDQLGAMFMRGK